MKRMTVFIFACVFSVFFAADAALAGAGGSGGGPRAARVKVEVCYGEVEGAGCSKIYLKVPAPSNSKPEPVKCTIPQGEAGEVPCPTKYGVPKWLRELSNAAARAGARAPDPNKDLYVGGP